MSENPLNLPEMHWSDYLHQNPAIDAVALDPLGDAVAFYGVPNPDITRGGWRGFREFMPLRDVFITGLHDLGGWQFTRKTQGDAARLV